MNRHKYVLKFIFLATLLIISQKKASAQTGWRIGADAGGLISRTFVNDTTNDNYKKKYYAGYRTGLNLSWGKSEMNGFSLAFHYVDKGIRYQLLTNDSLNTIGQVRMGSKFLEIPFCMYFKQDLGISGFVRENFGLGGAFQLTKYDSLRTKSKVGDFEGVNTRSTQFNAFFRLGIEVGNRFANGDLLTFGVHYQQGFGTVSTQNFNSPAKNINYFNTRFNGSYIGVNLGYHFNLTNIGAREEFFTKNINKTILY